MSGLLQNMVFLHPIILSALLALPLLWYLLRVTPPPPKRILFPATRFLAGLVPKENVPSKTPWWILLLRLLMAALLIIALAHPIINPAKGITEKGTIRIVMDNSWAGAQSWRLQKAAAEEILSQAAREGREIYIMTTAPVIGEEKPEHHGILSHSDALAILRGLSPQPWPADYAGCLKLLSEIKSDKPIHSMWLSHGLDEGNALSLAGALQNQGSLTYITPKPENMPLLLRPADRTKIPAEKEPKVYIGLDAPENIPESLPVSLQAQGKDGIILDIQNKNISPKKLPEAIGFDIVESLRNDITQFRINGRNGAGSVFLLDDQYKRRNIGVVASAETSESAPLVEAGYYLKRALEPHANLKIGTIEDLLKEDISMIVLPDIAAMPSETLDTLEKWVKSGGLLLRFSGSNMSEHQGEQYLLPVKLRDGGRSLSGSLSWAEPQEIAPFKDTSPFYGLQIPPKITIRQQVLADPAQDMEGKIWAELKDGTPLITGTPLEQGMIVLIHTTATPEWSDLALSGLFVDILQRLVSMAGGSSAEMTQNHAMLDPVLVLDGSGAVIPPPSSVRPLSAADAGKTIPNAMNPPGIYGRGSFQYALNIGTALPPLKSLSGLPVSVTKGYYEADYEIDLMPYLLYATLLLFIVDWMIMAFVVSGTLSKFFMRAAIPFLFFAMIPHASFAASTEEDIRYSEGLYLAYIKTGDPSLDGTFQSGLEALLQQLTRRTSVEPVGVAGLDPENDTLIFFPIIYWGISAQQNNISDKAIKNIQFYLDHGGTILFDTRDQGNAVGQVSNSENAVALRRLTSSLNIPPIVPIPEDHVLGRSFYLLDKFPGRYADGTLWLEQQSMNGRDGVSSVIIGGNDWASAWAGHAGHNGAGRGQARQQEMAMRFGINLVMYALTGNYKADQVHIPHILRRLGK